MSVREKCDEKNWEDGSDYGTGEAVRFQNLSTVTVAPFTSTIRGVPSEVVLNEEDGMKAPCADFEAIRRYCKFQLEVW